MDSKITIVVIIVEVAVVVKVIIVYIYWMLSLCHSLFEVIYI